jgi:hypothetical protein
VLEDHPGVAGPGVAGDRCSGARARTARLWRGARLNAFVKHFRIKQYLKDGRALRIETVVNDPYDLRF